MPTITRFHSNFSQETISHEPLGQPDARPHVLLVVDQLPNVLGGGERIVLRLASLLPQYGFRVSILTFAAAPDTPAHAAGCPIYLLPLKCVYDAQAVRGAFALRQFIRQQNVQIVQTFFESSDLWAGLVAKATTSAKLIWSRRDMGILRSTKHRVAYRWMAKMPDDVFAVSEQVREHCINIDHINPQRVQTIYNGLDLDQWPLPAGSRDSHNRPVITTVGNIRRVKGHDLFIRAAASVVRSFPDAQFSIAGEVLEPQYFSELQALIQELSLTNNFRFTGGINNLQKHLECADIFVLPSRSEGFSNSIIEAMAASLPVVATDVGGNREAVQDGETGYIVPPESVDALATAIVRLHANPSSAKQMGAAGRKRVEEEFSVDRMMQTVTTRYRQLLSNSSDAADQRKQ